MLKGTVGSNPSLSAIFLRRSQASLVEKYPRGRRGSPAKGVVRVNRSESSNLSFSAKEPLKTPCFRGFLFCLYPSRCPNGAVFPWYSVLWRVDFSLISRVFGTVWYWLKEVPLISNLSFSSKDAAASESDAAAFCIQRKSCNTPFLLNRVRGIWQKSCEASCKSLHNMRKLKGTKRNA